VLHARLAYRQIIDRQIEYDAIGSLRPLVRWGFTLAMVRYPG